MDAGIGIGIGKHMTGAKETTETTLLFKIESLADAILMERAKTEEERARRRALLLHTPADIVLLFAKRLAVDCGHKNPVPDPRIARLGGIGYSEAKIVENATMELKRLVGDMTHTLCSGVAPTRARTAPLLKNDDADFD